MTRILDQLQTPEQIRELSLAEKNELAEEAREVIIRQVARNGGHLASNLGIVELTIALLSVYDFKKDRIIFDVGHQSYAWKILTGREKQFATLRQKNGLSGFPKRSESPYDFFNTGHSSTSISAALGMLRAMKINGQEGRVIALIGDGALTGGMAFEALNDAGMSGARLVIIINDNQMSIDRNVGGLSRHLENLRISRRYLRLKTTTETTLPRIPLVGEKLLSSFRRLKQLDRTFLRRSGVLFEQLGFRYYGPINGHDLVSLERHMQNIEAVDGPVVLHVVTQKGRGYTFAESSPDVYHGVAPFEVDQGVCPTGKSSCRTYSEIFGRTILNMARQDHRICAISAAMTSGTGLKPFADTLPDRFFDVGIAEQHAMTLAAGMAAGGARPVLALYSTFLQRAYDQLLHDVCLQNLPVVVAVDRAGIVGEDGETHQGIYDLNLLLTLPSIEILCPASGEALEMALKRALNNSGPTAVRYPKGAAEAAPGQLDPGCFGVQVIREGQDCTLAALGTLLNDALRAAEDLAQKDGIQCEVLSVQQAKPFDWIGLLPSLEKTKNLIFIEETVLSGCLGQMILPEILHRIPDCQVQLLAIRDEPLHQGKRSQLLAEQGLDVVGIAGQVRRVLHCPSLKSVGNPA